MFAELKSSYVNLKFLKKGYFLLIIMPLFSANALLAQIDIKSKIDAQTYSNYSNSIDLFEPLLNPNDTITLFLPINYAFSSLSQEKQNSILVIKNLSDLNQLLSFHSATGIFDDAYYEKNLNLNRALNKVVLKSSNFIYYQKHRNNFLLGDSPSEMDVKFESHVIKSIRLNEHLVLNFMDGIFLF